MPSPEERQREFQEAAKPLMRYLCENFHPHVTVVVTPTTAELSVGHIAFNTDEFVKD